MSLSQEFARTIVLLSMLCWPSMGLGVALMTVGGVAFGELWGVVGDELMRHM